LRTCFVCVLLVLVLLSCCRSANQLLFPGDSGEMGPTDYPSWELKKDLERSEYAHYWVNMKDPWDDRCR
jgi:hypothetical protein